MNSNLLQIKRKLDIFNEYRVPETFRAPLFYFSFVFGSCVNFFYVFACLLVFVLLLLRIKFIEGYMFNRISGRLENEIKENMRYK